LSDQDRVNPGTSTKGGYNASYRMLAFRRIEEVPANPGAGSPGHLEGLRAEARVIRVPASGEVMTSRQLITLFLNYLHDPSLQFAQVWSRIGQERNERIRRSGFQPRVLVSGLGPVGLLAALESYRAGGTVVGIERRSQYTRPQILRLTSDTVGRIRDFIGQPVLDQLVLRGVISMSPNWAENKFDTGNGYIYPKVKRIQEEIRLAHSDALATALNEEKTSEERAIIDSFSPEERALREHYLGAGLELQIIDIIRINALETLLAAVVEEIARQDPAHMRVYYGAAITAPESGDAHALQMELAEHGATSVYPVPADILAVTEGAAASLAKMVGVEPRAVSRPLFGATVAFRLPVGFDIGLRPVENRDGTASVKGIAVIDPEKLIPADPRFPSHYHWTMVEEPELVRELNQVLTAAAHGTGTDPFAPGILLPVLGSGLLAAEWHKLCGGKDFFLPRTRYFFAGGLAYLGAELSQGQYEMFQRRNDTDPGVRAAAQKGLEAFMLILAKKHMPREYVEGQTPTHPIAGPAERADTAAADHARVITITELRSSLSTFPIVLRKAPDFSILVQAANGQDPPGTMRVVLLGDSFATTHFFTGSGAVNGLRAAMSLGRALAKGGTDTAWKEASKEVNEATDGMHQRVMAGTGNAPLDGPFNEGL
jgi:hypothetical protein